MTRRSTPSIADSAPPDISRHQRLCSICHHPEREAIEEAFLQWRSLWNIQDEFKLPSRTTIYRHAHALGLFARRGRRLRFALGNIIEKSETVRPTAEAIIHAIEAYTRLTDDGQWIAPPAHVVVSSGSALNAARTSRPPRRSPEALGRRRVLSAPVHIEIQPSERGTLPEATREDRLTASHKSRLLIGTPGE